MLNELTGSSEQSLSGWYFTIVAMLPAWPAHALSKTVTTAAYETIVHILGGKSRADH